MKQINDLHVSGPDGWYSGTDWTTIEKKADKIQLTSVEELRDLIYMLQSALDKYNRDCSLKGLRRMT